eukprot:m.245411 g.245411  ORF g.245411 m.245411 type:complete len:152 (-) comp10957_c0_seq9:257-712(-)
MSSPLPSGIACVAMVGRDHMSSAGKLLLSMTGKMMITSAFALAYVYPVELFPANARSAAMGFCTLFSRAGGVCAPMVVLLGSHSPALPYLIFGSFGLASAALSVYLPETLGRSVAENTEAAETEVEDDRQTLISSSNCQIAFGSDDRDYDA